MTTLLASLLGFIGATIPDLLKLFRDRADRQHELTILQMQIEREKMGLSARIEEIETQANIAESQALYRTYHTGIHWVDALNGTVRPVLAYAFFLVYAMAKATQFSLDTPWLIWTEEDQAIFSGIISFYFGQRAMGKARKA